MKLILKILAGFIGLLVLAIILIPIIFKDNLVEIVKTEANKNLNAQVNFGEFDLSIIKNFPQLTFSINDVSVIGKQEFEGVTLANIGKFSFTLDVLNVVTGSNITINSIAISDADFTIKVLKNGKANYDITIPADSAIANEEPETASSSEFKLALNQYTFKNVNFIYDDKMYATLVKMEGFNHTGTGDFSLDVFLLETQSTIEKFTVEYENIAYFKNTKVDLDMDLDMDLNQFKFTFKENALKLNNLNLMFNGWVAMPNDDIDLDISFDAPNNSFKSLLSLVPAIYSNDFEGVETSGNFSLSGFSKGTYNDTKLPAFNLKLLVSEGRFNYPDLPKSAENININFLIDNKDGVDDHTIIDLKSFNMTLGDNPIKFSMFLKHPISDPDFSAKIQSQINFESLTEVVPLDESMRFSGTITADAEFAGKMSALENEQYDKFLANGKMILTGFEYADTSLDYPIKIPTAYLTFTPQKIDLSKFELILGNSDFRLDGSVGNFLPYYLHNQTLAGSLALQSNLIDANQLMGEESEEAASTSSEEATETGTNESAEALEIPNNIDVTFTSNIQKLIYTNMEMSQLKGKVTVKNSIATLENFSMNMLDGSIDMSGAYNAQNLNEPLANFNMNISNFDVQKTFNTFNSVQKIAPIGESATGNFSTQMKLTTKLLQSMEPDLNSLSGNGLFSTQNMVIDGSGVLKKAADVLKNDKYTRMELKDTKIKFAFENGEIVTQPFDVNIGGQKATVSGKSKFEGDIDYLVATKVPKSSFGQAANQTLNSLIGQVKSKTGVDLSSSSTIDLQLIIAGTVTDPTVKPAISGVLGDEGTEGVKTQVKEKIQEKIEETKEDLNQRIAEERAKLVKQATQAGDQLIAEAQKQKAALVDQATQAAAKLKSEATAQANQLKKDAGSNPVKKKAAELAGDKLIKEADKKGADLIAEANKKGDDLVTKAREKKQQLITEAENKDIEIK